MSEGVRITAGKHLKPYQGLKPVGLAPSASSSRAGKHLKPYQGLKQMWKRLEYKGTEGRKTPKTLSGIETEQNRGSWIEEIV